MRKRYQTGAHEVEREQREPGYAVVRYSDGTTRHEVDCTHCLWTPVLEKRKQEKAGRGR